MHPNEDYTRDSTTGSSDRDVYSELLEEKGRNQELERKVKSLEFQVEALQDNIYRIRNSTTYKAGLAIANCRDFKSAINLPFELYKLILKYKKNKSVRNKPVSYAEAGPSGSEVLKSLNNKKDSQKLWLVPLPFSEPSRARAFSFSRSDNCLSVELDSSGNGTLVFAINEVDHVNFEEDFSDIEVSIEEFSPTGHLLRKNKLEGPVESLDWTEKGKPEPKKALAFSIQPDAQSAFYRVQIHGQGALHENFPKEIQVSTLEPGVSVVVPTYKGENHIRECLNSLGRQTLDKSLFEVVVIINGEPDSSIGILDSIKKDFVGIDLNVIHSEIASASLARNLGILHAKKNNITFIDDDDTVSENFLESMYCSDKANEHVVELSSVLDIVAGEVVSSNITHQVQRALSKNKVKYADVSSLLTMNACKLLPTFYLKHLRYDESMRSGEDVCLFSRYFTRFSPRLSLDPVKANAIYYRSIRAGSVSRPTASFDFSVKQRLLVIKNLDNIAKRLTPGEKLDFVVGKINAQSNFIFKYIKENANDYSKYVNFLDEGEYTVRFHERIASALSETLVYSYCFIPYVDTAAVVMAKRIRQQELPVDIVYNDMRSVREEDPFLEEIAKGFVGQRIKINTSASFSNWRSIAKFADKAFSEASKLSHRRGRGYSLIYSRVMWPGSHFAALIHKINNPNVKWVAEFSDPVLKDVHGNDRISPIDKGWLRDHGILEKIRSGGYMLPKTDNMFFWCEYLTYIFSDEIVFTNKNQLSYMASYINDDSIEKLVFEKATISPHPTLEKRYYSLKPSNYKLPANKVNFAYFGNFYATRGMSDIFKAISTLPIDSKNICVFHIFTNDKERISKEVEIYGIKNQVVVNDYVSYFEFLSLAERVDCLVVNDASTEGSKVVNPYLPSKYSDYSGSSSSIWGICEKGSVLYQELEKDMMGRSVISYLGDYETIYKALLKFLRRDGS